MKKCHRQKDAGTVDIEIPFQALEIAARAREHFPGLTDIEIVIELLKRGLML